VGSGSPADITRGSRQRRSRPVRRRRVSRTRPRQGPDLPPGPTRGGPGPHAPMDDSSAMGDARRDGHGRNPYRRREGTARRAGCDGATAGMGEWWVTGTRACAPALGRSGCTAMTRPLGWRLDAPPLVGAIPSPLDGYHRRPLPSGGRHAMSDVRRFDERAPDERAPDERSQVEQPLQQPTPGEFDTRTPEGATPDESQPEEPHARSPHARSPRAARRHAGHPRRRPARSCVSGTGRVTVQPDTADLRLGSPCRGRPSGQLDSRPAGRWRNPRRGRGSRHRQGRRADRTAVRPAAL
jgi:hypothetical protein